jgi:nicotinamide phosphoribosyltransferase
MPPLNPILDTDSYKASHYLQYPPGTEVVSSYIESRGGDDPATLFFGLQRFLKGWLARPVTADDVEEAEGLFGPHGLPFNRPGWRRIVEHHGGIWPLEIEAVAEGSLIPTRQVLLQVRNTDPALPWLTTYLETALLRAVWYPTTVATISHRCRTIIRRYLEATADSLDGLGFKLHDFGARGVSSGESAAIGGLAHLVNFQGTDTVAALVAARDAYHEPMAGSSIPAAEHSTITAWGPDGELDAYRNMLDRFAVPGGLVAVVSDSYDLWHAIDHLWGEALRERVERSGATLVVRPDSGDPIEVVVETVDRLMARFGAGTNRKGYRILPDHVRVIQGDGVSPRSIEAILAAMQAAGQSADNVAFGMGSSLLQRLNRDTHRFAMKASAVRVGGVWRDVWKSPATDAGKASKRGRLALIRDADSGYATVLRDELAGRENLLRPVYRDGELLVDESLATIRERAAG